MSVRPLGLTLANGGTILGRVSRQRSTPHERGRGLAERGYPRRKPPGSPHRDPEGERQYHIGLGPGDLAEYILLPGDPDRTTRIAARFDAIELEHRHREFASVTGTYRGQRVSVVSTGIGTDNVEIVVAEILAITERPTFIRVGSCGGLQPEMDLGDLVITTGAVRLESTTSYFVHDGYPAVADYEAVVALIEAAERLGHRYHVGLTATAPGFFGAQGRPIPQLPIRYPDLAEDMARQRVMNFEMEASALLVLAALARCRAGVVCAVYAQRTTGEFVEGAAKDAAEAACVETGLESLLVLAEMDAPEAGSSDGSLATVAVDRANQAPTRGYGTRVPVTHRRTEEEPAMAEAYCVKDKMKVEVENPQQITMKNGKPALQGTCPKCGGKVFKIGG